MDSVIDFKKLLQEERKRNKKNRRQNKKVSDQKETKQSQKEHKNTADRGVEKENNVSSFNWNYPVNSGILELRELRLRSICEDPQSIFYSSTALQKKLVHYSPEAALTNWLQSIPNGDGLGNWKTMSYGKRRVCMFGEEKARQEFQYPMQHQQRKETTTARTIKSALPQPLAEIAKELVKRDVFSSSFPPNHVLLNEYQPGQGILAHTDGSSYESRTATLSLGSDIVIEFRIRLTSNEIGTIENPTATTNSPIQVLLEAGSLLVFQGNAYINYCHGIPMDVLQDETTDKCLNAPPNRKVSRGLRFSLTFRHKKRNSNFRIVP